MSWGRGAAVVVSWFSLAFGAVAADQAMPYCFHLDETTDNAGSAVLSTDYKVIKDGSSYDCFSSDAKFGTKAVGGGSSGPAGTYYVTAPTVGDPLLDASSDWTLSMWVNYRGTTTHWCNVGGFSIGENCFRIQRTDKNTYQLYCDQTTFIGNSDNTKAIPGGSATDWVNLIFVYHAATQTLDIYSNAELWGSVTRDAFKDKALTSISMGNYVLKSITDGSVTKDDRSTYTSVIDEVAVYDFAANGAQIAWLGENAPSMAMFGEKEPDEITAYYKSGYFGNSSNPLVLVDEAGKNITYTGTESDWTVIIDSDHLASGTTTAWCAEQSYYRGNPIKIVKIIVTAENFTFKPGVTGVLFDGVAFEVAKGAKLTLTNEGVRTMSVGSVTFSGAGTINAATGVTFTKDVSVMGDVQVSLPSGTVFVAQVGDDRFTTLAAALAAAGDDGLVEVLVNSLTGGNIPESWRGTVRFSGDLAAGFKPANYGNAQSTIELKGASGYLAYRDSFAGTLKLTNDGETPAWRITDGFKEDNFVIGRLTGDGDLVDASASNVQQFSFKDASTFGGSITTAGKRFVIGAAVHGSSSQYTARIYVEKDHVARVAKGKTFSGKWGLVIDGTVKGSGTLTSPSAKTVIFGFANDGAPTIDLAEGALTVADGCTVQFNKPLTLKNAEEGAVVLRCAAKPANLETVQLKDADGNVMPLAHLEYADGQVMLTGASKKLSAAAVWTVTAEEFTLVPQGYVLDLTDYLALDQAPIVLPAGTSAADAAAFLAKLTVVPPAIRQNATLAAKDNTFVLTYDPMTLYWAAWRGTFWEHIGQTDANGNHGLMRDGAGNLNVAHRPNDTVVFDKTHYTVDGNYLSTAYWHYDENLYIKNEVVPGTSNKWDLKVLQGVTLKMGLRGSRAAGQNVINALKIYVEENSTLELGYWGNAHHYQGVIRDDVVFGGAGTIALGSDMGTSCRVEGDITTKGDVTPIMDVRGKELAVQGGQIDINLTGFGKLSGSGTITTPITFNNATIDATSTPGFTFKNTTTFTGTLTVDMTSAPAGDDLVKICTKGEGGSFVYAEGIDVIVRVNGTVEPAFYTLATDADGNLCVKVAPVTIDYDKDVVNGYDYKTMIARVTMTPAIEGVAANVTVKNVASGLTAWSGEVIGMRGSGRAEVMVGNEDDNFAPGIYTMTVTIGDWSQDVTFTVGDKWFEATPGADPVGGEWVTESPTSDGKYQLSGEATFNIAVDKAAGEVGVIEQVVTFTSAADAETLAEAIESGALDGAKGAMTLAEGENGELCWMGRIDGAWVGLTGVAATLGEHTIRLEYDRTGTSAKMRYFVDGTAVAAPLAEGGDGWFVVAGDDSASAIGSVSYVGSGALAQLTGFVDDPALVAYNETKYKTMEAAVAAWKANSKSGVITLLTNIYFAPEPGTYQIQKNGFKLYLTNDMIIEREEGTTVVVGFPPVVDRYTNGLTVTLDGEKIPAPFIIDGEWLGKAIPWKTRKNVQTALKTQPTGSDFTYWQSYVLGFRADEAATAKAPAVRAVQNAKQDKVTLGDGLEIRPARETGVVVTRKLVGSVSAPVAENGDGTMTAVETAYDDETGLPEFDLTTMEEKVQYLKISYEFSGDAGQE